MKKLKRKPEFLVPEEQRKMVDALLDSVFKTEKETKEEKWVTLASFMPSDLLKETLLKKMEENPLSPVSFATYLAPHIEKRHIRKKGLLFDDVEASVLLLNTIYEQEPFKRVYDEFLRSRNRMLDELSARRFDMRIVSSVIVGLTEPLGSSFPPLHPLYGFPYIPARLVRGALKEHLQRNGKEETAVRLCGAPSKRGTLILFDGVPKDREHLHIDFSVACCHHPLYYRDGTPPDDWHEPQPHLFFVLPQNSIFRFAFCCGEDDDPDEITGLIKEALSEVGVGARRSRSYGLLSPAE